MTYFMGILMLATMHDDIWNVLNMQHITPDLKRWGYSYIPSGGHKKIQGPTHMVATTLGDHHLRKAQKPHPWKCMEMCT